MGNTPSVPAIGSIPHVEINHIEESTVKRDRTLRHLLRANHINYSVVYNDGKFYNHLPHMLCSAYLLGAEPPQLNDLYESESKELEQWKDSPGEVTGGDWRNYLGDKRYQRAFVDLFEDELLKKQYDWKKVLFETLLEGDEPLINGLIGGLGHPLIHLGYALEFDNREVAMEALALAATNFNFLHNYIDLPAAAATTSTPPQTPLSLLQKLHNDTRFDNLFSGAGLKNLKPLFTQHEPLILEYFNALPITTENSNVALLNDLFEAAILFVFTTPPQGPTPVYDFFAAHTLTTCHALRIVLPFVEPQFQVNLFRQQWFFILMIYIMNLRPEFKPEVIENYDTQGKGWDFVADKALTGRNGPELVEVFRNEHFVKTLRILKEGWKLWPEQEGWYLKAAVKLASDFTKFGFSNDEDARGEGQDWN